MIQFYLLSVVLNVIAGYALYSFQAEAKGTRFDGVREFIQDSTTRLLLGVLCGTTGMFKLLTVMRGDLPVIGDLVPAVAGMAAGFTMLLELYRSGAAAPSPAVQRLDSLFVANRRIIGIVSMASGLIHFLFANVLFL